MPAPEDRGVVGQAWQHLKIEGGGASMTQGWLGVVGLAWPQLVMRGRRGACMAVPAGLCPEVLERDMEIQSPCMETTVACGGDVEGDGEEAAGDAPVDSLGQDPSRLSAGGLCVDDAPPGQVAGGPVATPAVTNAVAQTPTNTR
ncbi:unnamed protein product [Closterium sp. NIES-65]|nr:unnamed protein product [Closterium sp. NIES-65]CAI5978462.1 unnamed protein product [Closterium sp. NIES-65]CAI6001399.1 unnamed protein product [Closterium sp. NIES-65]